MPVKEICRRTRRHKPSLMCILVAFRELPPGVISPLIPCSGSCKKISERTDFMLKMAVKKNPLFLTPKLLQVHTRVLNNVNQRTVRRRLQKGHHSNHATVKPLLISNIKKKMRWISQEIWTLLGKWVRVKGGHVRRPLVTNRFASYCTTESVKHPDCVMAWGVFSCAVGGARLYFLPKEF